MFQVKNRVLWNEKAGNDCYKMGLTSSENYSKAQPGQFITLRMGDQIAPLLRRPFSIHRLIIQDDHVKGFEILYKVVGTCTKKLSLCKTGDIIDVLGPLGNSFPISDISERIFIVGGGIGIAPLVFLGDELMKSGVEPSFCEVFIGGRTKNDILCREDFLNLGMAVHTTTDDGSTGKKGFVTTLLETEIQKKSPDIIYACGPLPMLKAVSKIAEACGVLCYISVETVMACGMGVCLGCAVEDKTNSEKYMHICADGPVFDTRRLLAGS